jgi:lipopolysaccharide biosynthesis regulator YciM
LTWPDVRRSWSRLLARVLPAPAAPPEDPEVVAALREAAEARRAGRTDDARRLYRRVLDRSATELAALRGLRDLAIEAGAWRDGLEFAARAAAASPEREADGPVLAAVHYELGRADLGEGRAASAVGHFKGALKVDRDFAPAVVALGDALEQTGDHREAVRTWERAVEQHPVVPLLTRLERAYREEGRPSRMIALYRSAVERSPHDLSIAVGLGRVYFELEMLDEAADQFEKIETGAPNLAVVHAYLGAVFERRGQMREACEEYRRALRLAEAFHWPQRCRDCAGQVTMWRDRCPHCGRWNSLGPAEPR